MLRITGMRLYQLIPYILAGVGAFNWLLIGLLDINIIQAILSALNVPSLILRLIYILAGVSGIWIIKDLITNRRMLFNRG